jgi:hypothetical protein
VWPQLLRNLGLVPVLAALPPALEWHMVEFQEPPYGESRIKMPRFLAARRLS